MKKLICLLLSIACLLSLCACDSEKIKDSAQAAVSKVGDKIKEEVEEHKDELAAAQDKAKEGIANVVDALEGKTKEAKEFITQNEALRTKLEETASLLNEKFANTFVSMLKTLNMDDKVSEDIIQSDDLCREFVECMYHYEEFYDAYCSFYQKYAERDAKGVAASAASAVAKYAEAKKALDSLQGHEFTTAERKYLREAQSRVETKLNETRDAIKNSSK